MNIYELKDCELNQAVAYTLGLIYPLYKEIQLNDKFFIVGCINHNPGRVTDTELAEHFRDVMDLFSSDMGNSAPVVKTNKTEEYTISRKKGFSILVEKSSASELECLEILTNKVKEIKLASEQIKKEFVRGCFDGRASWDNTAHYLSIDVDRDYQRQDLIVEIINSLNVEVNLNRREVGHSKNDQIRIKPSSIKTFMDSIGLYSACRRNIIIKALMSL